MTQRSNCKTHFVLLGNPLQDMPSRRCPILQPRLFWSSRDLSKLELSVRQEFQHAQDRTNLNSFGLFLSPIFGGKVTNLCLLFVMLRDCTLKWKYDDRQQLSLRLLF